MSRFDEERRQGEVAMRLLGEINQKDREIKRLRDALEKICDYWPVDDNERFDPQFAELTAQIKDCPECQRFARNEYHPSWACNTHFMRHNALMRERERDTTARRWSEPKAIAHAALEGNDTTSDREGENG